MSSYVQEFLRGIPQVHEGTAQALLQLRQADERTSGLAAEVRQLEQQLLDELRHTAEFKGEDQYAERLQEIAAKRRKLNDEMATQGHGIRAVYSVLDEVITTLDHDIAKLNEVLSINEMMQFNQSKSGRRKSDARKGDRIGSTILMPDLKETDDAVQPKYCYCQQISFGTMIGCDNEDCKYEWFHSECLQRIGISNVSSLPDAWMCPFCASAKAGITDDAAIIHQATAGTLSADAVSSSSLVKQEPPVDAAEHKA